MKKAEEYFKEFTKDLTGIPKLAYEFHKLSVLEKIRTIQLDAAEYAVNKCAENAKAIDIVGGKGYVIKTSILSTINQIKEELE